MGSSTQKQRNGPNVGTQAVPDTSCLAYDDDGSRRREGDANRNGKIAIADVPARTPGGLTTHHCPFCHTPNSGRCLKKGCIIECAHCGVHRSAKKSSSCWGCEDNAVRAARKQKEQEEATARAERKLKTTVEPSPPARKKSRWTANQHEQSRMQQVHGQQANQQKQISKTSGIAKWAAARPVKVRKRKGRVGRRGLSRSAYAHMLQMYNVGDFDTMDIDVDEGTNVANSPFGIEDPFNQNPTVNQNPFTKRNPFTKQNPFTNQYPTVNQNPFTNQNPIVNQNLFANQQPFTSHNAFNSEEARMQREMEVAALQYRVRDFLTRLANEMSNLLEAV